MKKRWKLILTIVVVLLVAAAAVAVVKRRGEKLTEVTVAKVEKADLTSKVAANGRIEAQRHVDLSADVMGQIVNLGVREGDVVEAGDFLLQIDRTRLAADTAGAEASIRALFADRDSARASLVEAQANHDRARSNFEQKIIPQADLDRARSALDSTRANVSSIEGRIDQARAALSSTRSSLSKTTITSPIPGVVTSLPVEEGEVAVIGTMNNPGTILLTISDLSVMEAVMEVDETDVPAVKVGQQATVTIDAYPNQTFDGLVTTVGSSPMAGAQATSEAVNFEVKIQLTNPPEGVRPGFSASAEIFTGSRPQATAVPIQALVVRDKPQAENAPPSAKPVEEEGVFVFDPDSKSVKFATVTTGLTGDTLIEVVTGLQPGQQIVTGPFKSLREIKDGDKVKIAEDKKPEGAKA